MNRVVVDCSTALAWYFEDETDADADALYKAIKRGEVEVFVPMHFFIEATNGLLVGLRRGRCVAGDVSIHLHNLLSLQFVVDSSTSAIVFDSVIDISQRHKLSAYDAAYIELALRMSASLLTLDKRLPSAAAASGITLFAAKSIN